MPKQRSSRPPPCCIRSSGPISRTPVHSVTRQPPPSGCAGRPVTSIALRSLFTGTSMKSSTMFVLAVAVSVCGLVSLVVSAKSRVEAVEADRVGDAHLLRRHGVASQEAASRSRAQAPSAPRTDASPGPARPAAVDAVAVQNFLEDTFASEAAGSAWSRDAVREATEKVTAALPEGSALSSVDCRDSLCRIETTHTDFQRYRSFVRAAFVNPKTSIWNGGTFSSIVNQDRPAGAPLVTVAYIAKDGQALPTLPE